ncbi:MAG: transporter substrate-binding domain-containing protein [Candidatus Rokubacteria bacterium]|nr:transporter substrate-binding domain-containing protein [Candidatus Rokubacteria bacterium]
MMRQAVHRQPGWRLATAVLAVATVFVVAQCGVAAAQDTLTKIKTSKYALLASYNEPPHDWFDPADGKWKGIDNDIVEYILRKLGAEKWDFIVADWSALIPGLQAKRWDLMSVGMSITDKRKQEIAFSEPIYQYGDGIVVKKGNPKKIRGKADWAGKRIGGILGATSIDEIKAVPGATAVPYKQHGDMFADVKAGRIDAALADETTAGYAFVVNPEPDLEVLHEWQGKAPRPSGIGFRKEDVTLKAAFDEELRRMKADGTLLAILKKYGLTEANLTK